MIELYNKKGESIKITHPIDVSEILASGEYSRTKPVVKPKPKPVAKKPA